MKDNDKDNMNICLKFYNIYLEMLNARDNNNKYIDISTFLDYFGSNHSTFSGYIQHDAQEFFRLLLDDLSKELNVNKKNYIYNQINYTNEIDKILTEKEFFQFSKNRENSLIIELFYNEILTKYTCCICSYSHYAYQNIFDFPLLLPDKEKELNLEILIKNYFYPEIIKFENKCNNCKKIANHLKEMLISRPSPLLIFSIQRLNYITQ